MPMFILCQAEVVFMAFAHPAVGQEDEHELLPCVAHAAGGDVPRGREPLPVRSAVGRPNLRLQVLQAPDNHNTKRVQHPCATAAGSDYGC